MLLTIYIPTYKRVELADCLEGIVPQLTDQVEVIVSDNDGSAKEIVSRFPKVTYTRRYFNIEGDPNVVRGLVCGTGEYVWVFGDDDTMLPGTIQQLLPMLNGVDRVIHWSPNSMEVNPGFSGTMPDYIKSLEDKSILVASTLISANVWRRAAMDVASGLRMVDTKYPLFWAGLNAKTVKIMPVATITVGYVHTNVFGFFNKVIDQYLKALMDANGLPHIDLFDALRWNFVNVSK